MNDGMKKREVEELIVHCLFITGVGKKRKMKKRQNSKRRKIKTKPE